MDKLIIGCGYLGRRVAQLWLAQGHRVFGTTRSETRVAELRHLGVEPVRCDVLDSGQPMALPHVDTVVYCVGMDRSIGRSMRDVYVGGLGNVLAQLPRPKRLIYVSSTGVYGQTTGAEVDESAATEPVEESGKVVKEAEELVRSRIAEAVLLRFAGIYGPDRVIKQNALQKGEAIVGDLDKWLNLIHVDDGASAVLAAESRGRPGEVYHVCDDRPVRRREFYGCVARLLGAPEPRFMLPAPGAPLPPHERANRRIVNRKMRDELGVELRYPSYQEGLRAILTAG